MEDINRYDIDVKKLEIMPDEYGKWVKYSDHKAVVEIKDKIIEDLKVEKLMILRDQVDETITMQNKIDELEDQLDLLKSCENCYAMDCDGCKRDISSFRGNQQDNWKGIK